MKTTVINPQNTTTSWRFRSPWTTPTRPVLSSTSSSTAKTSLSRRRMSSSTCTSLCKIDYLDATRCP
uniref:Uncharacterized protein n=1 Tax=Steinernema glaseri TaxID=37863 RepID=A0A1I7YJ40_9BILA